MIYLTPVTITRHDATLAVQFDYDHRVIALLRVIPGSCWHPHHGAWAVPAHQLGLLAALFAGWPTTWYGITPPTVCGTHTVVQEASAPSWAASLFTAVGPARADAVFRALARVLHPDTPTGDIALMRELLEVRNANGGRAA